jgi:hypothetical protein
MRVLFTSWRVLVLTVLVGMLAGLSGAWIGTRSQNSAPADSFPTVLRELIDATGLQPHQREQVDELTRAYLARRAASAARLQTALEELASALVDDGNPEPEKTSAADRVDAIVHERRIDSMGYISAVRRVLDDRQRREFDVRFLQMVRTQPPDSGTR